ncbi:MAG: hypothetical protein ISR65_20600 [Bacteriovoracaceae bacterium]|nr:hypothetical protein [Bacteriovoracaceae bacterium]
MFDAVNLIDTVFALEEGEVGLIIVDIPHNQISDNEEWKERRLLAEQWHKSLSGLAKIKLLPMVEFPATGSHNSDLPLTEGTPIQLSKALEQATFALALTEFSSSAPLIRWAQEHEDFRAASLPMLAKRMEQTALAADYKIVANRCHDLEDVCQGAVGGKVKFSSGHVAYFDLRFRKIYLDAGELPRFAKSFPLINLPSGEICWATYEGETKDIPSMTEGQIPLMGADGKLVVFTVKKNHIVNVSGESSDVDIYREFFDKDQARTNIAEFAFGCNPSAVVWGNLLEDEKAGFHFAYGRSDHIGGITGVKDFSSLENVNHTDIVYAKDSPIKASLIELFWKDGSSKVIIKDGDYVVL